MELKLLELRRYAIDNRVEIRFGDPDGERECAINNRGQVKIPNDDREFRIEEVLSTAERFEIVEGGKSRQLNRGEMAEVVAETFKNRGFAGSVKEEE
ncbi:MAG TPA: hypothetical protein VKF81_17120 [Blastocatellia bacterium]|nr:hypothetical protein [Blastocatellia bacterium]